MTAEKAEAPADTGAPQERTQAKGSGISVVQGGAVGNNELAKYDATKFNVLHPVMVVQAENGAVSPLLADTVSVVQIDPKGGDTYHDFRFANERDGKAALSGMGLAKIASAAGIQWDAQLTHPIARERRDDGHVYVAFQAAGRVRQPNGEYHVELATADIDTADAAEEFEDTYRRKIKSGRAKYDEDAIPEMVKREVLQLKKFALRHAETKAKNRVIRRLLSLKQVYALSELARPFAVPRLLYRPETAMAIEQGRQAVEEVYGSGAGTLPGLPSPSTEDPPPADVPAAGATGPGQPRESKSGAPESEATAAGASPDVDPTPKNDPMIEDGEHKGKRYSEVAETDPGYLRGIIDTARAKAKREAAQAWLDFQTPKLGETS